MAQHNPYIILISQMDAIKLFGSCFCENKKYGKASFDQKSAPKMPLGLLWKVKPYREIEP